MDTLLSFMFMESFLRKKEVALHYDIRYQNKDKIQYAEKLHDELQQYKEMMKQRYQYIENYIYANVEKGKMPNKKVLNQYDETREKMLAEYKKLADAYNQSLIGIPNDLSIVKDEILFKKILFCANTGLLILAFGDKLEINTLEILNIENIHLFFALSVLFSEERLWQQYNISKELLATNIQKLNKTALKPIFFEQLLERMIKVREETDKNFFYKNLINDFKIDDLLVAYDLISLKGNRQHSQRLKTEHIEPYQEQEKLD